MLHINIYVLVKLCKILFLFIISYFINYLNKYFIKYIAMDKYPTLNVALFSVLELEVLLLVFVMQLNLVY